MSDIPGFHDGGEDDEDYGPIDEMEELTPERVAAFLDELKFLTLRHKIEIGGMSMRDPYLVHTDATNGFYVLNDDEEQEGLLWAHGIMIQ